MGFWTLALGLALAAELHDLEAWSHDHRLSAWWGLVAEDLEDPERQQHLVHQLTLPSVWRDAFAAADRPVLHLVDVVPADPGWQARPLTRADAQVLARALRDYTGKRVQVLLRTEHTRYGDTFEGDFRELPQGAISVTATRYRSPTADPAVPILYTFAARTDDQGRRVLVSASGGRVDEGAWVGSAARPIGPDNVALYAHELLHSLGILHHYAPGLYRSVEATARAQDFLVGTDCIMSANYVGGFLRQRDQDLRDAKDRLRMIDEICPICRYLLAPGGPGTRRWSRRYRRNAIWLRERLTSS